VFAETVTNSCESETRTVLLLTVCEDVLNPIRGTIASALAAVLAPTVK